MDLFTTGPSLNFLSSSSPTPAAAIRDGYHENNVEIEEDTHMIKLQLGANANNNGKAGAPKYSFNKSNSFNRTSRNNMTSMSYGSGCTLVALIEGRGNDRGQIGMVEMDIRNSELNLCQFVDTNSYSLLRVRLSLCGPVEIIVPEDKEKSAYRVLITDLFQNTCPKANVTPILRRYFNDALGIELIKKLAVEECSNVNESTYQKYYCMGAAAALIKYVEYIQNILYARSSLKVTYVAVEESCMIDVNSWKSLDLIHMDLKPKKGHPNSLFETLNCCVTPGGMKTLRSYLLQPSINCEEIDRRLDVVQELVTNQAICDRIRTILSTLSDLQQLISLCTYISMEQSTSKEDSKRVIRFKITQAISLKTLLEAIKQLSIIVGQSKAPFFTQNKQKLDDCRLDAILEMVTDKITTTNSRKRKGSAASVKDMVLFAVADGQHVVLDLARRTYQELVVHILEFSKNEQKEIPGAQLNYSQSRGYHFSIYAKDPYSIRLPLNCIQIVYNKTSLTFTTRELIKYNDRLMESESEILSKSNLVLDQLLGSIREYISALYNCAELVSLLDYYTALACYASKVNTVRPTFGTRNAIKNGRHPVLDYRRDVVPNSTFASHEYSRFALIAGPNMAGKSTYMRQVCLLQILAQMGSMVPADYACFFPVSRIYSRIGHNDDLVRNLSGFAVEMTEMAVILQNSNRNSLIIIDELARSTSTEEGIGVCYAICERLLATGAFVFFATHFLDMAQLEVNYPVIVKNYHFASSTMLKPDGTAVFALPHQLQEGAYRGPLYGLDLAELTTFPQKILIEAREMAERMRKAKENVHNKSFSAPALIGFGTGKGRLNITM